MRITEKSTREKVSLLINFIDYNLIDRRGLIVIYESISLTVRRYNDCHIISRDATYFMSIPEEATYRRLVNEIFNRRKENDKETVS